MISGLYPSKVMDDGTYENVERLPEGVTKIHLTEFRNDLFVLGRNHEDGKIDFEGSEVYTIQKGQVKRIITGSRRGKALTFVLRGGEIGHGGRRNGN